MNSLSVDRTKQNIKTKQETINDMQGCCVLYILT